MTPARDSMHDLFTNIADTSPGDTVAMSHIRKSLEHRGFWLLMLPFAAPFILPLPYPPGFSTVVAIPLIMIALQMIARRPTVWLIPWIEKQNISKQLYHRILNRLLPYVDKLEAKLKPRLEGLTSPDAERWMGVICLLLSLVIATPIPFSHFLPGIALAVIAFGMMYRDGLFVLIGMGIGALGLIFVDIELHLAKDAIGLMLGMEQH